MNDVRQAGSLGGAGLSQFSGLISGLNDRQREAVLHTEGPLVVLAGAGSGKTKMLTSRIAYLIEAQRVPAYQVLAMTFTNKAAAEMRHRVEKNLLASGSGHLGEPEIGTFHSVCVRLLRRELGRTPFTQPFVIYDDSDQLSLIKTSMAALQVDDKMFNPKAIQSGINRAKCDAHEPADLAAAAQDAFGRQLARIYEHYQKSLFSNQALDFGEIICLVYRLLRDHPDLRQKYQQRFRYIHVDEYQDTNRAQYLLLSMLASASSGGHQNICVVGDEDQSIYKWRGADIKNILDFERDYPGAHLVKLEQNYRSTKTILAAAGHVIKNNRSRKDKTLWTENAEGQKVIRAQLADERAEAEMAISEIKREMDRLERTYNDFAIFYRTNAQSRQFEDVLRREKIPYQVVGGLRFYDRKEIKDVLCYLKCILNSADSVSLKRVMNVPARGIGKTTLEKLEDHLNQVNRTQSGTYWEVLQQAAMDSSLTGTAACKKIHSFVQLMRRLTAEQPKLLLSELYHLILDETGYVRALRAEGTEESLARIENLEEFNTILQEFEEDQLKKPDQKKEDLLSLFIEQTALASDVAQAEGSETAVKLMTLHSSKGLEFPVVFLVGMEDGLFPSIKTWGEISDEDLEEERRLCYVGMTRAREVLYLMGAVIRRIWGDVSYQEPSRFFHEIPDEYLEIRDFSYGRAAQHYPIGSSRHMGQSSSSTVQSPPRLDLGNWVGRNMNHPEYGFGTVVDSEGSGTDQKVTIRFHQGGQKKFLLRYVSSFFS
jgi:DNA helicase-2/ATP-dependent DNA helicase PcrA